MESKIRFKPPIIAALAREAGIEPGVLDLLKRFGLTSEAELRNKLGLSDDREGEASADTKNVDNADRQTRNSSSTATSAQDMSGAGVPGLGPSNGSFSESRTGMGGGHGQSRQSVDEPSSPGTGPKNREGAGRPFISYVAVTAEDEGPDPDGLDHAARMALESKAIDLILLDEPCWERTPTHNPGYDLYEPDLNGAAVRWCEVKAMTGSMNDRPIGLSRAQFKQAQENGVKFWLYVVEHAGTSDARILRIQDPAGKARTFTFDRGWIAVANGLGTPEC